MGEKTPEFPEGNEGVKNSIVDDLVDIYEKKLKRLNIDSDTTKPQAVNPDTSWGLDQQGNSLNKNKYGEYQSAHDFLAAIRRCKGTSPYTLAVVISKSGSFSTLVNELRTGHQGNLEYYNNIISSKSPLETITEIDIDIELRSFQILPGKTVKSTPIDLGK